MLKENFSSSASDSGRIYDARTGVRWLSVDPLADKHPEMSPYNYCNNDPVNNIDPDGKDVRLKGEDELEIIRNTLPEDARDFVRLDCNGLIDRETLNNYTGTSSNYVSLKTLVNSEDVIYVALTDKFIFVNDSSFASE